MKPKIFSILLLTVINSFSILAFAQKTETYRVDGSKSSIVWKGDKVSGSHTGTVDLTTGTLDFTGKKLTGGGFVINMASIKDADKSAGLEKHLKADDFFGVEKFPTAHFIIKKVEGSGSNVNITGNLTLKGVTQSISFPATITWNSDKTISATADKITVDRTKFGIQYKSKSIFSDIGDKFIYDEFTLSVNLLAKK
ncbi:YceI family protein [Sphingobacterium spiritivorum]|uniref:YceI family protein n=1 Tax=Sphingobacterium spiritivorum TaxID=258 RepID=UPI003DA4F123